MTDLIMAGLFGFSIGIMLTYWYIAKTHPKSPARQAEEEVKKLLKEKNIKVKKRNENGS